MRKLKHILYTYATWTAGVVATIHGYSNVQTVVTYIHILGSIGQQSQPSNNLENSYALFITRGILK